MFFIDLFKIRRTYDSIQILIILLMVLLFALFVFEMFNE